MSTGYVVGLNIRLKSSIQLSNSDMQRVVEEVRLTAVSVPFLMS